MKQYTRYALVVVVASSMMLGLVTHAYSAIRVFGSSGCPRQAWGAMKVYMVPQGNPTKPIRCEDTDPGQWTALLSSPGTYVAAVEDASGFGPVVRPGIQVTSNGSNQVNMTLNFQYDLLNDPTLVEMEHTEFGQTFVAEGSSITGIVFRNSSDIMITLHENNASGRMIGKEVNASAYYPHGVFPTVPGRNYYLKFYRKDGAPFKMQVADRNPYHQGQIFLDGNGRGDYDLAIRLQYDPVGQILRYRPGNTSGGGSAKSSYGQTFTARGNGLAMVSVFPISGDRPDFEPTITVYEGGPGGTQVGSSIPGRIAVFGPGDLPLTSNKRYYIEVSGGEPFSMWASVDDDFPGGNMYMDGKPVSDRDMAMVLVEYENDNQPPTPPRAPSWLPGMPTYAQRFLADGKTKIVWDVPQSNDITKVRVRRVEASKRQEDGDGSIIAEIPVSSAGRQQYVDKGLKNGNVYHYTIRTVDHAGNESEPLHAPVLPLTSVPLPAVLLETDLAPRANSMIPYGWTPLQIAGNVPSFRVDGPQSEENPSISFGWEVQEGRGMADTVLYQQVACEKGRRYEISAEAQLWNPWDSRDMVIMAMIGMDPTGGIDPLAKSVVWGSPTYIRHRIWSEPAPVAATAQSDTFTVFLRGYSNHSRLMNTRFRDVEIKEIPTGR